MGASNQIYVFFKQSAITLFFYVRLCIGRVDVFVCGMFVNIKVSMTDAWMLFFCQLIADL